MSTPNHPLNNMPLRGLYPPSAYPYPAYIEVPWERFSINSSGIIPQDVDGILPGPVPLNAAPAQHNGYGHGIILPPTLGWVGPADTTWSVQQGLGALSQEQSINRKVTTAIPHTMRTPARTIHDADATAPAVIRHTIGTPAMISSVNRRRVRPRRDREGSL
ncbi:hypothetical protein EYR40_009280 [Pleurotus pulmonarius]|nr:hypothetical protein EYR40_009280 [Pleurotus pulmonarius]